MHGESHCIQQQSEEEAIVGTGIGGLDHPLA
jgi:hypothetical protein